jgi:hypothetical protein
VTKSRRERPLARPAAIGVRFPTGVVDVGWGRTTAEAASYALKARAEPWYVQPERRELAELRVKLGLREAW